MNKEYEKVVMYHSIAVCQHLHQPIPQDEGGRSVLHIIERKTRKLETHKLNRHEREICTRKKQLCAYCHWHHHHHRRFIVDDRTQFNRDNLRTRHLQHTSRGGSPPCMLCGVRVHDIRHLVQVKGQE